MELGVVFIHLLETVYLLLATTLFLLTGGADVALLNTGVFYHNVKTKQKTMKTMKVIAINTLIELFAYSNHHKT